MGASFIPSLLTELTDTPSSLVGQALKHLRVNAGATALEFAADTALALGYTNILDTATGDGKSARDGVMTSGSAALVSALGKFTSADVGKAISVKGAGVSGADLITTVATYVSATEITLSASASTDVTYVAVGWGTDDSTAIQTAITAGGRGASFYFPPDTGFYLAQTDLISTELGQSFFSLAEGAELICGGLDINDIRCAIANLRFTGASTYGIIISDPSLQDFDLYPNNTDFWWTALNVSNVRIWDKTYGIYNIVAGQSCMFSNFRIWYCDTGIYINHNNHYKGYAGNGGTGSASGDSGDWEFTNGFIRKSRIGWHIVKIGGLTITSVKIHNASDIGMLIETTGVNPPARGIYCVNLRIEDCTNYDLKVSSTSSTSSLWPQNLMFVGGTMNSAILLDKVQYVNFAGAALNVKRDITLNSEAALIFFTGCDSGGSTVRSKIVGASTSYTIIGNEYIATGRSITLYDSANPLGKTL